MDSLSLSLSLSLCVALAGCNKTPDEKKQDLAAGKKDPGGNAGKKDGGEKPKVEKASLPKKDPQRETERAAIRQKLIQDAQKREEKIAKALASWATEIKPNAGQLAIIPFKDNNSAVFTPDASRVVWQAIRAGGEPVVRIMDLATGKVQEIATGHKDAVLHVAVSADSSTVLSQGLDALLKIWTLPKGALKKTIPQSGRGGGAIAFSPDGKQVASILGDELTIFDAESGEPIHKYPEIHRFGFAFSPDGSLFAACRQTDKGSYLTLWDTASGGKIQEQKIQAPPMQLAFSPDGWTVASLWTEDEGGAQLWDIEKNSLGKNLATANPHSLAFSPDGKLLAVSTVKGLVLLEPQSAKELKRLDVRLGEVTFCSGGSFLASMANDQLIKIWSVPALLGAEN